MATKFGEYTGSVSPIMKWYAEYDYTRISNDAVRVIMTVVGDIVNKASTSYMGTGNNVVITATVAGQTQTHEIKSSSDVWRGSDATDPRSHTFIFDISSATAVVSIPISYSVAGTNYTAAAKVPTRSTSFSSPALLYVASTPSMASTVMGVAATISTNRQNASMTHTLSFEFGNTSGEIGTDITDSVQWTPPLILAGQVPNATSGTGTITCDTYIGGTLIGTKTIQITLLVPDSIKPSCYLDISLVRTKEPADWGVAVQGYTKVNCVATAAGSYGSTIRSYSITGGGYSSALSSFTTGVLNTPGENTFMLVVTDTRGRTSTDIVSIFVHEYTSPTFSSVSAYRSSADGTKSKNGTYIRASSAFIFSSVDGKNSASCRVAYRRNGSSIYSGETALESGAAKVIGDGAISAGLSYVATFALSDSIQTVTYDIPIGTAIRSFHIKRGGRGAAFGKVAEKDGYLDSDWIVNAPEYRIADTPLFDLIYPIGSIYMSVNPTSPADLFGGNWVRIQDRFLLAAGDAYSAGTIGGEASHTLTVDEMPSHFHKGLHWATPEGNHITLNGTGADSHLLDAAWGQGLGADSPIYTESSGGNQPHNNMPPYVSVYIWKRVESDMETIATVGLAVAGKAIVGSGG